MRPNIRKLNHVPPACPWPEYRPRSMHTQAAQAVASDRDSDRTRPSHPYGEVTRMASLRASLTVLSPDHPAWARPAAAGLSYAGSHADPPLPGPGRARGRPGGSGSTGSCPPRRGWSFVVRCGGVSRCGGGIRHRPEDARPRPWLQTEPRRRGRMTLNSALWPLHGTVHLCTVTKLRQRREQQQRRNCKCTDPTSYRSACSTGASAYVPRTPSAPAVSDRRRREQAPAPPRVRARIPRW